MRNDDMAKVNALLSEAVRLIGQARELLRADAKASAAAQAALIAYDTPIRLDDLREDAIRAAVADLPEIFDTWHVIDHPAFQRAHAAIIDRPAINQLAGKYLRKYEAELGITLLDRRGRKRSARWHKA